jgi:tRNA(Ile)-lysidine synthase
MVKELAVLERVRKTITRYNMLPRGGRVAVAVSGGPDSVCLLHVLRELARVRVSLVGRSPEPPASRAESNERQRFVAGLAERLGLRFIKQRGRRRCEKTIWSRRSWRAGLFAGLKADRVALGHTRDDQAETVLFRLLRGSGLRGLAGIYPVTAGGYTSGRSST